MENNETEVINIGASAYRLYSWKKGGTEYKRQRDRQIIKDVLEKDPDGSKVLERYEESKK